MGAAHGGPGVTSVSAVTYPVVRNTDSPPEVTYVVDVATAPWLTGLGLFNVPHGSGIDPRAFDGGFISALESGGGTYVAIWKNIGAGNSVDLYVSYLDPQGRYSPASFVATTSANPAGTTAFGPVGTTAPNPRAAFAGPVYYANGASTFEADFTIHLDANGTTSNNNLAEIEVVIAPASRGLTSTSAAGWVPTGAPVQKNSTGDYDLTAGGLGAGTSYTIGVRYVGHT